MPVVTPKLGKGLGRIKDKPDKRDYFVKHLFYGIAPAPNQESFRSTIDIPLPTSMDVFLGLDLPVYDQGSLGSCTANAGVLYRRFIAQRFSKYSAPDEDLSRLFLYFQERLRNGDPSSDSGASVRDTFMVLVKTGVCPEVDDPYNVELFASESVNNSLSDLSAAKPYDIGACHRAQDVNTARSVLASGYAIELGFTVYESFESIGTDGIMPMPQLGEQVLGGHAVVIRGYDDQRSAFRIQNSWGAQWGDAGCFWMPYAFLENEALSEFDMWMGHLGKAWN